MYSFIAADYDDLKRKIDSGEATPEEMATFVDYCVEIKSEKIRSELEMELQDSEIAARIADAKTREAKAKLELDMLVLEALERLDDVTEQG